jgi:periplasmic protein TonB
LVSVTLVILIHTLLAYLLIYGLNVDNVRQASSIMKVSNIAAEVPPLPEPPPPKPEVIKEVKPQGAASAKNLKSKAVPREAPKPIVKLKPKKQQTTAEKAGKGNDASAGNSDQPGPETGAGGQGTGTGAGGSGKGAGGIKIRSRAKYLSGRIKNSDYPRGASKANVGGAVIVRFTISVNGRAGGCRVTQSSGNAELDNITCRLIEKRFRYEPGRDTDGNAIEDVTGWKQDWWLENKGEKTKTPADQ